MPQALPDGAPVWVSFLVYGAAALGALAAIAQGWRTARKPASNAPNAIIAGDIMDTRPMKDLVVEMGRMNDHLNVLTAAEERRTVAIDRNTDALRDLCLIMARKD